jgi:hypothetical protein
MKGNVVSFPPQPRRAPGLGVRLLDGGGRVRQEHVEAVRDAIYWRESLPYSDAHPINEVERTGRRLRRWVLKHDLLAVLPVAIIVGLVLAWWLVWRAIP